MFTKKFASRSFTAALALGLIACGGAKDGGESAGGEGGEAAPAAEAPATPTQTAGLNGETEYTNTCGTCHQATGEGMPGAFPPLAGSDIVNMQSPDKMIAIILKGLQGPVTVKGQQFNSAMAAWESMLSDEQIAAITTHERSSWGNSAPAVTPEMVAAVRTKVADRTTPWTIEELDKVIP